MFICVHLWIIFFGFIPRDYISRRLSYNPVKAMKFLHISDLHLGSTQYNLPERTKDFGRAWAKVLGIYAIDENVDFVIICGDLFDKRIVTPQAFDQAFSGLEALKEAKIPAILIEGNHDDSNDSSYGWLRTLRNAGLVILLEPIHDKGKIEYREWNDTDKIGAFVDITTKSGEVARLFGSRFSHAPNQDIPMMLEEIKANTRPDAFQILMLHTDIEGHEVARHGHIGKLSQAMLRELKSVTHYIGLGHTHKRIEIDNWAFNPGSLEACKADEYKEERGAFLVEVDANRVIKAKFIQDYPQRPFYRTSFDVSGLANPKDVNEGVLETITREITPHDANDSNSPAPIIELSLRGILGFPNSLIEFDAIRDAIQKHTNALSVRLKNHTTPQEYAVAADATEDDSREKLERKVLQDLVARDNRYKREAEKMAEMIVGAKQMALNDDAPEKIFDYISLKTV